MDIEMNTDIHIHIHTQTQNYPALASPATQTARLDLRSDRCVLSSSAAVCQDPTCVCVFVCVCVCVCLRESEK